MLKANVTLVTLFWPFSIFFSEKNPVFFMLQKKLFNKTQQNNKKTQKRVVEH